MIDAITDATGHLYGAMLPERVLYEIMKAGWAALKLDPSLVDDLLYKLDEATRDDIKAYLTTHTVTVRQNFPKDDITFPIVVVTNGTDDENAGQDVLGDYMHTDFDGGLSTGTLTLGHALDSTYNIYCLAGKDSNAVLWLYYLSRALMMINYPEFDKHGIHNALMSGRDVTLREDLFPEFTFARMLTLRCLNYFAVRVTERVANSLVVRVFTEDVETGISMQLNVEDP